MHHLIDIEPRHRKGMAAAGFCLLAGLVLAGVLKLFDLDDSAIFIGLLFFTMLGYLVFSDTVAEISAPGGWNAKFRDLAQAEVKPEPIDSDAQVEAQSLDMVEKSSVRALGRRQEKLGKKPVAMTLQLGRRNHYDVGAIRTYLRALLARDDRLQVILVDDRDRFVAAARGREMLNALEVESGESLAPQLIGALESGDLAPLEDSLGLTRARLRSGRSNAEALREMMEAGVEELVVTDPEDHPAGIVRRDDIMARLLVNMTSG